MLHHKKTKKVDVKHSAKSGSMHGLHNVSYFTTPTF